LRLTRRNRSYIGCKSLLQVFAVFSLIQNCYVLKSPGYWKTKHDANETHFVTGDSVVADEEGTYYFQARVDDVIKSSGYRISPTEIEATLIRHDGVG
jgi:acyl-coenzyme A synthetase/AMP-(fatty) acid ligase